MPVRVLISCFIVLFLAFAGCKKSDSGPGITVSGLQKAGQTTNFNLTATAQMEQWDFGDSTTTVYCSNSFANHLGHVYRHAGNFKVTVKVDNKYTVSRIISIEANYAILYSGSPVSGDTLHFYFPAFLPAGNIYSWEFGDGTTSFDSTPSHVYASRGDYNLSLSVNGKPTTTLPLHIFNDPIYTSAIAGTRTYQGISWVSLKAGDTTILPEKAITIKYVDKVTLSVDYTKYTFNEQFSSADELYYTTKDSRDLDRIYYNRLKDSISINTTSLYSTTSGTPDVIYRFYHTP